MNMQTKSKTQKVLKFLSKTQGKGLDTPADVLQFHFYQTVCQPCIAEDSDEWFPCTRITVLQKFWPLLFSHHR